MHAIRNYFRKKLINLLQKYFYIYLFPMHSIGVGIVFYYKSGENYNLLLQRRSLTMSSNPGKIGFVSGYVDGDVAPNGKLESPMEAAYREAREEMGDHFANALPERNPFTFANVAHIRHKTENNALGGMQSNFQFLWILEIDAFTANRAYPAQPEEVLEVLHIPHHEVELHDFAPWIPDVIKKLVKEGHLPPFPMN